MEFFIISIIMLLAYFFTPTATILWEDEPLQSPEPCDFLSNLPRLAQILWSIPLPHSSTCLKSSCCAKWKNKPFKKCTRTKHITNPTN